MHLTLIRHGQAGSPPDGLGDADRTLTEEGRRQASATGQALADRGVTPTHVWHSPLVRAVETARLVAAPLTFAKAAGPEGAPRVREDLYPHSAFGALVEALAGLPADADVIAVGHEPYMSAAASALLDTPVSGFSTGAAFRFELYELSPLRASLSWRWTLGRFIG